VARPRRVLATNDNGHSLLSFDSCSEAEVPDRLRGPLPLALVVVRRRGQLLMVFDRWKGVWELPGGRIESNESPRAAATRELREETGIEVERVGFAGLATYLMRHGSLEHGAVFRCDLAPGTEVLFEANEEIAQVTWWTPGSELDGLDELDAFLAKATA
jgi:8-oxo-dGTP diphosphatase